jgi:hypothetical protein
MPFQLNTLSSRTLFVCVMTFLATAFGVFMSALKLGLQTDLTTDLVKIGLILLLGTALVSRAAWAVAHIGVPSAKSTAFRGALAGLITALLIIPLPRFSWVIKRDLVAGYEKAETSVTTVFFESLPNAVEAGLYTFTMITKASLAALIGSMIVGYVVAVTATDKLSRSCDPDSDPS